MSTEYIYNVVFICPESLQTESNQLACIMGLTAEDVNTFNNLFYENSSGDKFSVVATVATQNFIDSMQSGVLYPLPSHAAGCDRDQAVTAFDSVNTFSGLQYYVDTPVQNAISGMGLTLIPFDMAGA
jgi:hypothetical protein